ncbi:MAG: hypothetical protein K2P43_04470 [Lachnospiraceae bacterium]|nr:hypothetical protein [Lachnospiraceae bacterium]
MIRSQMQIPKRTMKGNRMQMPKRTMIRSQMQIPKRTMKGNRMQILKQTMKRSLKTVRNRTTDQKSKKKATQIRMKKQKRTIYLKIRMNS